jgi:two-component system, sensor histidine kinase and response regulator
MKKSVLYAIQIFYSILFSVLLSLFIPNKIYSQAEEKTLKIEELSVEKCLDLAAQKEKAEQYRDATEFLNRAAYICWDKKELDKAIEYYLKSIELNKLINNSHGITAIYSNLGMIYSDRGEYKKALECFQKTLDGRKDSPDKANRISTLINMSIPLKNLKRYSDAAGRLQEALILARELNDPDEMKKCYGMLAETYEKAGNNDSTIYYFNLYRSFHEYVQNEKENKLKLEFEHDRLRSLLLESENRNKELELMGKNFEIKKKDKELFQFDSTTRALYDTLSETQLLIELLKKNEKIKELQISENTTRIQKEENLRYFLSALLILLIIIIVLIIRRYQVNRRMNLKLSKQNSEILQQQKQIAEQNLKLEAANQEIQADKEKLQIYTEQLQELNATKDKFFSIIAHDLKNPFQSLLGFSELLKINIKNSEPQKVERFINQIYDASKQGFNLLENLLEWARSQTGNINFIPQSIALNQIITSTVGIVERQAMNKNIKIYNDPIEDFNIIGDVNLFRTVMLNLLTNAIKFTSNNGNIYIKTEDKNNQAEISIIDTGIGISRENIGKLFKVDTKRSSPGTNQERGTGLGLILCKEFLNIMGGDIYVESEEGKGSTFKFTIPKNNN